MAEAVDAVGGVCRSAGSGVEVATMYPGGRVLGIVLRAEEVEVHVISKTLPLPGVADAVHRAVRRVLDDVGDSRQVAVRIADLDVGALPLRVG
jgi:hypothetical protein